MPRIKGWNKIGEDEWQNRITEMIIKIEEFVEFRAGDINTMGYYASIRHPINQFKTNFFEITEGDVWKHKEDVVQATKSFMRNNPEYPKTKQ